MVHSGTTSPSAARKRFPRRLGLIFAVAAIAGPALMTVGSVAKFSVEPSQRAPDKTSAIDANQPGLTASLVPKSLPVRKVVTTPVRVARPSAPQTVASEAALLEDRNTLEQHNPRPEDAGGLRGRAVARPSRVSLSHPGNDFCHV